MSETETETDLPKIPCYTNENCNSKYNCGDLCVDEPLNICESNNSLFSQECHGNNSEYCSGILSCCDPDSDISCLEETNYTNGATNTYGNYLGCDITADNPISQNCQQNTTTSICMEFDNFWDRQSNCNESCWVNGGYQKVKHECETKIGNDKNMCKAMEYFCDWDSNKGLCTLDIDRADNPPFNSFGTKYVDPVLTLPVLKNCGGESKCIEIDDSSYTDNIYVRSSQSSWDASKRTSYDSYTRINCAHNTDTNKKVCISLPRCQYVNNPCECGSINVENGNQIFMCANSQFSTIDNETSVVGNGYCTWCKGTQSDKNYEIPEERKNQLENLGFNPTTREITDWNLSDSENCESRCGNYNECEVNDSETLWNKCMYEKSDGKYGISPSLLNSMTPEEQKTKLKNNGFCYNTTNSEHIEFTNQCEKELEHLGSMNWGRVFSPSYNNTNEIGACQYRYNWVHTCVEGQTQNQQISENYVCTWCPSLQCKTGSKEQICSVVSSDLNSDNVLLNYPYCATDSNHGEIVSNNSIPEQCDCLLPKLSNIKPKFKTEEVILSTSFTTIAIIVLFMFI